MNVKKLKMLLLGYTFLCIFMMGLMGTQAMAQCPLTISAAEEFGFWTYTFSVENSPAEITSFGFDMTYNASELSYVGTFTSDTCITGNKAGFPPPGSDVWNIGGNDLGGGVVRVGGFPLQPTENLWVAGASGCFIKIAFEKLTGAPDEPAISLSELVDGIATWCDNPCNCSYPAGGECEDGEQRSCYSGPDGTEGVGECVAGTQTCVEGQWGSCADEVSPTTEICDNGLDDDCDGATDGQDSECGECNDGEQRSCYSGPDGTEGVGECIAGTQTCADGQWGACEGEVLPSAEICEGQLDENCDGTVDDGCDCTNGDEQPCYTGPAGTEGVGECFAGMQTCADGQWGACEGEVTPVTEICNNGLDDDCDGATDLEDSECGECISGDERSCYTGPDGTEGVGECIAGTQTCTDGQWGACEGEVLPSTEICEGQLDENCDGTVDDGCDCTNGDQQSCYTGPAGTEGVGECVAGTQACVDGVWGDCIDEVTPLAEICDNQLDDDCDGATDTDDPDCPVGDDDDDDDDVCPFNLSPQQGTTGTVITITGSGFGDRKGIIRIGDWKAKVLEWTDTMITVKHVQQIKPSTRDVTVLPLIGNYEYGEPIVCEDAFTVLPPSISSINPGMGACDDEIIIQGMYFSTVGKFKVYIKVEGYWKKPEVLYHNMDPVTGESQCAFRVPCVAPGTYDLYVRNLMDWSNRVDFTIKSDSAQSYLDKALEALEDALAKEEAAIEQMLSGDIDVLKDLIEDCFGYLEFAADKLEYAKNDGEISEADYDEAIEKLYDAYIFDELAYYALEYDRTWSRKFAKDFLEIAVGYKDTVLALFD